MLILLLIVVAVVFAFNAIRAGKLLTSTLWLAGTSAILSVVFYILGALQVAVIELSVGAGLVTVLFVIAINIAGDEPIEARPVPPRSLVVGLVLGFIFLLGWYILPTLSRLVTPAGTESAFGIVLWQQRGLDVLVQSVLIFSGVLGLLGLLAESKPPLEGSVAAEVLSRRENDMQALEEDVARQEELQK
jgi:uncharacterized MnhB-related membrane protein